MQDKESLEEDSDQAVLDRAVLDQVVLESMELGPEGLVQAARAQVHSTYCKLLSKIRLNCPLVPDFSFTLVPEQNNQLSLPLCELYNKWKFALLHRPCVFTYSV